MIFDKEELITFFYLGIIKLTEIFFFIKTYSRIFLSDKHYDDGENKNIYSFPDPYFFFRGM